MIIIGMISILVGLALGVYVSTRTQKLIVSTPIGHEVVAVVDEVVSEEIPKVVASVSSTIQQVVISKEIQDKKPE